MLQASVCVCEGERVSVKESERVSECAQGDCQGSCSKRGRQGSAWVSAGTERVREGRLAWKKKQQNRKEEAKDVKRRSHKHTHNSSSIDTSSRQEKKGERAAGEPLSCCC